MNNPPEARVKSVINLRLPPKIRVGRGFSLGELKAAGINEKEARKLGLRVDKFRRSAHEFNVELLKNFLGEVRKSKQET
ncbi:MAG: ribosomal protein L13e [Candidatus Methanomethylicia archaeon]